MISHSFWCCFAALVLGCTGTTSPAAEHADAVSDEGSDDVAKADSAPASPTWRDSLSICWTDLACKRAFVISHGGDWSLDDFPYDSEAAFHRAANKGADGIKTDVHVTKDNIAVVAHSSPILFYESSDCADKKIEEMTADEVTQCHLFPSDIATFQRLDAVLKWARGKVVIMLTVKESKDFARAIQTVIEQDALDYVFLETAMGDLQQAIAQAPNWQKAWYNASVDSADDITQLTQTLKSPRVAFCEISVKFQEAHNEQMAALIKDKIHAAGMRGFVSTIHLNTAVQHKAMWELGFDVIMTYNLDNAILARKQVNTARGVEPP